MKKEHITDEIREKMDDYNKIMRILREHFGPYSMFESEMLRTELMHARMYSDAQQRANIAEEQRDEANKRANEAKNKLNEVFDRLKEIEHEAYLNEPPIKFEVKFHNGDSELVDAHDEIECTLHHRKLGVVFYANKESIQYIKRLP